MKLPEATHIGFVHLRVADLDRALHFYAETLGFRVREQSGQTAYLSATGHEPDHLRLTEFREAKPGRGRTTGLFHAAIRMPDRTSLARVLSRLIERKVRLAGFSNHGVSEAVYLNDPEGNGLELYADRPRNEWPRHGTGIEMTSQPLDVESLLDLARSGEPWQGIDSRTDIGHVHLQVSRLDKAEAFYHGRLGFDVTQRSYPGALFFAAGGYHHHVAANIWAGTHLASPQPEAAGLISFSIVVPDPETWKSVTKEDVAASNQGILDPFGIRVELLADNSPAN
jgi:catechol 2,3-dioxygenase